VNKAVLVGEVAAVTDAESGHFCSPFV
jgi:hypothetical protein